MYEKAKSMELKKYDTIIYSQRKKNIYVKQKFYETEIDGKRDIETGKNRALAHHIRFGNQIYHSGSLTHALPHMYTQERTHVRIFTHTRTHDIVATSGTRVTRGSMCASRCYTSVHGIRMHSCVRSCWCGSVVRYEEGPCVWV